MSAQRFSFLAEGKWDVVADCESAGIVDEQIRAAGEQDRLSVRHHPWLEPGMVIAFQEAPFEFGPEALRITPRLPGL
jgi:hypothetical protein